MGRTVMAFSSVLEKQRGKWKELRKSLSKEEQEVFDGLIDRAKFHTAAAVFMARPWPSEKNLVSIIPEHEKMLGDILGKIKKRKGENN